MVLTASCALVLGCAASCTGGVSQPWFRWQRLRVPAFFNKEAQARSGLSGVSEIVLSLLPFGGLFIAVASLALLWSGELRCADSAALSLQCRG